MQIESFYQLFRPFSIRLANILTRARVVNIDTSQPVFSVMCYVRGKPAPELVPLIQQYGFVSVPPADSILIRAHLSADADNPLIVASIHEDSVPENMAEGDSGIHDNRSQSIKLGDYGIKINSTGDGLVINSNGKPVMITGNGVVSLGDGGEPIARMGDSVEVVVGAPGDQHYNGAKMMGKITGGGANTSL